MSKWKHKLNIKDIWSKLNEDVLTIPEGGKLIAEEIRKIVCYKTEGELWDIANGFDYVKDTEEFDEIMTRLYDWGDISLDNKFGGEKMCWIATN